MNAVDKSADNGLEMDKLNGLVSPKSRHSFTRVDCPPTRKRTEKRVPRACDRNAQTSLSHGWSQAHSFVVT